jgi:hypothetical protein
MAEERWVEKGWGWLLLQLVAPSPWRQIALPVIVGVLASLLFDFGGDGPGAFYAAAAQVAPVLALAAVVEPSFSLGREVERLTTFPGDRSDTRWAVRALVHLHLGLLLVVEASALYALGSRTSSTFLLVTVVGALAAQLWWLAWAARSRYRELDDRAAGATQLADRETSEAADEHAAARALRCGRGS